MSADERFRDGDKSAIEWTDVTWNSITGRTNLSQGCLVQHWLRRKYVSKMNPPPVRPQPDERGTGAQALQTSEAAESYHQLDP